MFPAAGALALLAPVAAAHAMQVPYTLPVPLWLYAYGATGALLASFVVVGYFVKATPVGSHERVVDLSRTFLVRMLAKPGVIAATRIVSVALLAIVIVTGLFGSRYPAANFSITFFWIIFALGFTYAVAIVGDVYRIVNPWLAICEWCERARPSLFRGRISYPASLGYYPALVLYMGWIWLELFGLAVPRTLSLVLIAYSVLNFAAAWLFGKDAWFRHGELLGVFFRLFGMQAPIEYRCGGAGDASRVRLRAPFVGLWQRARGPLESAAVRALHALVDRIRRHPRHRSVGRHLLDTPLSAARHGHRRRRPAVNTSSSSTTSTTGNGRC
jgi:hypothetical protein